ncbi:unnamed protein product [Rotaria sordida]|uniref:NADP-dependent oxidoreductase domain-containing protein n=2 Tax=Rotaria sordida TaxID=392033 RepID=A0A815ZYT7_9BILA|nr:unnamed protein product [Rotaria sordida]
MESTTILNDGTVMPMFGLGVYRIDNNCTVGIGIQQSGKKREDVFIISKWWPTSEGANGARRSLDHCLKNLKSNYVDLYMIHAPKDGCCGDAYRALIDAKKEGKIR